jgi:tRNA pseudouridine65 synthase
LSGDLPATSPLVIVHRDDWLCAIHKPSGLLVHRTPLDRGETRFAVQCLRDQIGRHVHPVHRLDRGTSGVMLFALDRDVARALGAQFEAGRVVKRYVALVRGHPSAEGTIDHPLRRLRDDRGFESPGAADGEPQRAVTHYRRLAVVELPHAVDRYPTSRYGLVELTPETGRRHQIRRHMKHVSHPVIGDATYGKGRHNRLFARLFGSDRLLLACVELELTHPATGKPLALTAPPADDFLRVIAALGWDRALAGCRSQGAFTPVHAGRQAFP